MASKNQILNRSESEYDLDIGDYANFQLKFTKDRPSSRQGSVQSDDRDGRFSLKDKSANPTDQDEKSLYDIDSKSDNEANRYDNGPLLNMHEESISASRSGKFAFAGDDTTDQLENNIEDRPILAEKVSDSDNDGYEYTPMNLQYDYMNHGEQEGDHAVHNLSPSPAGEKGDWIECYDESSQMNYYFNQITGESTWDRPASLGGNDGNAGGYDDYNNQYGGAETNYYQHGDSAVNTPGQDNDSKREWNDFGFGSFESAWKPSDIATPTIDNGVDLAYRYNASGSVELSSDDEVSATDGLPVSKNILSSGYDTLKRRELLEDEEERMRRKFEKLKRGAAVMRSRLGWEEWLSAQGAIFYAEKGKKGGQWKIPQVFERLDAELAIQEKSKSRLQRKEYLDEEKRKANAYAFMIQGWEEKRNTSADASRYDDVDGLVEGTLISDVFDIKRKEMGSEYNGKKKELSARDFAATKEVTPDMLDALEDKERYDEYGNNIKLGDRYNGKLSEVTTGMKQIYKALRSRDTDVDVAIDAQALEKRTQKAKLRWQQYLEMKTERERSMFGTKVEDAELDSDEDDVMNFTKLYSRSIIAGQRWPWTKLVDIETDRQFYRNEMEDYFQFAPPPEFGGVAKVNTGQGGSTANTSRRRQGVTGGINANDVTRAVTSGGTSNSVEDVDSKVYLREKFNREISARRDYFTKQNKILRELERGQPDLNTKFLSPSRRMKAALQFARNRSGTPAGPPAVRKNSVFYRGVTTANQSPLEDLLPPERYRVDNSQDRHRWRDLSEIQSGRLIGKGDKLGWHDSHTLLLRLRRFSDLKHFLDQMQTNTRRGRGGGSGVLVKGGLESLSQVRGSGIESSSRYKGVARDTDSLDDGPSVRGMTDSAFVVSSTQSRFRFPQKDFKQSLSEVERTAAQRRQAAHRAKQRASQIKAAVSSFHHLVDISATDESYLESEIVRRHLLETAVFLKSSLSRPLRKNEMRAYTGMRRYVLCPHNLKASDLSNIPGQEVIELQRWNVHIFDTNLLSSCSKDPSPSNQLILYSKKSNGKIQSGVPFDIKYKQWRQPLKRLRWYDNGKMYSGLRHGKRMVDLASDAFGGILFFCPVREVYSWKESIDASYYDILSDTAAEATRSRKAFRPNGASMDALTSDGSTVDTVERAARMMKKDCRTYKPTAVLERRNYNIWAEVDMTKPANRRVSVVPEEESASQVSGKPPKNRSPYKPESVVPEADNIDPKFRVKKFMNLFVDLLKTSNLNPSYIPLPKDHSGPRITAFDEPDTDPLEFEDEMTTSDYMEYTDQMYDLIDNPNDVPTLLSLCEFLFKRKLIREVVVVLIRVLEVSDEKTYSTPEELAIVLLLTVQIFCKATCDFRVLHILKAVAELCPENSLILAMVARVYHLLRLHDKAEELYVGSLLLDPTCGHGLRGYGLLMVEKGNLSAAGRYLSRVDGSSRLYLNAKVESAWVMEMMRSTDEALQLAYQAVLSSGQKCHPTSLALASLGHFYHVRGEPVRAVEYYSRCLQQNSKNAYCLIMHGCASASTISKEMATSKIQTFSTLKETKSRYADNDDVVSGNGVISRAGLDCELIINKEDEAIDAKFRRGLFYLKGGNRWIALLAYAEFITSRLKDMQRAEDVFWEAARLSATHSVWPAIALAHFYLYIRDDVTAARRVLLWASQQREIPSAGHHGDDDLSVDDEDEVRANKVVSDKNQSEEASVCVAHAYCHFVRKEYRDAQSQVRSALKFDKRSPPALRCLGLIEWFQGHKSQATKLLSKAYRAAPYSPHILRSYSIALALSGQYADSLEMINAAAEIGGNTSALTWRAAGQMIYLYDQDSTSKERAQCALKRAFELSGEVDIEAGRLRAQILMEEGKFTEAASLLRCVIPLKPCDPVALASLGLCLAALGKTPPSGLTSVNYGLKIKLMDDPAELGKSDDPEELFEAATMFNLSNVFLQKSSKNKGSDNLSKGWSILQNYSYDEPLDPLEQHDSDVPPIVLYWYGMYCLQKGGMENNKKAKSLFMRASQRADYTPYLLALQKLGWLAETKRDLRAAERYYCYALQLEPVEPHAFLQLSQAIKDTRKFVSALVAQNSESIDTPSEVNKKTKGGKRKKNFKKSALITHTSGDDEGLDTTTLQKRHLLHDRVSRLCDLRKGQMRDHLNGIQMPGKFVYFEPFWLEQYMEYFSDCDDWSWLLKCSHEFRTKSMLQKKAPNSPT